MESKLTMRHSGVELLRIFAACFVVATHYFNPQIGGALLVINGGGKLLFVNAIIAVCCCAVNCFVLITGYYSFNSKPERPFGKPFYLFLQVVLFHFLTYAILILTGENKLELHTLIALFLPTNYFVSLYIALYFISPLVNKLLNTLSKVAFQRTLIILVALFSIYPSLMDVMREISGNELLGTSTIGLWGSQYGYTIVNFVLVYVIGAYLRKFDIPEKVNIRKWSLYVVLCTVAVFIWKFTVMHFHEMGESSAFSYLNPFVIFLSVSLFGLFSRMNIHSKIVNELAGAAFTCFLFHQTVIKYIGISEYASGSMGVLVLHFTLFIICIYILSYFVFKLLNFVLGPLIRRLNRYYLTYEEESSFISKK